MSDPKELRIGAKSDDIQNLEVTSHLSRDLDCPSPDPSIEATRAEIDNLTVSTHAERDPDWALNCRWEDWLAASGTFCRESSTFLEEASEALITSLVEAG